MIRNLLLTLSLGLSLGVTSAEAQEKILGKTTAAWGVQLKDADPKLRRGAAYALGKFSDRASIVIPEMKNAYAKEKDVKVREAIIFGMGEIFRDSVSIKTDGDVEKLLLSAITDADPYIRRSAAFSLGCLASKTEATRSALDTALGDKEAMVKQNAAFALAQFAESALPSLQKALRDDDSFVKRDAASVIRLMEDGDKVHEILKDLLPLCRDTNSEVRSVVVNILASIVDTKDQVAIPPLKSMLEDKDIANRRSAAIALGNIGGEEAAIALPILLEATRNANLETRRQSVKAHHNIGKWAAPAVPDLIRYLREDKDAEIREFAALALAGIGTASESAVESLVQKVQDSAENRNVRFESAKALGRIGPVAAARAAVPTLLAVLGDPAHDSVVRERLVWALQVHNTELPNFNGAKDAFAKVTKEPLTKENRMLRYNCAYMLGVFWRQDAPESTLDVLEEFLRDNTIKIATGTKVGAGSGGSDEIKGGKGTVKEKGKGDGRVMATDALQLMTPARYAGRADIMKQLHILAADEKLYPPLRKASLELVNAK